MICDRGLGIRVLMDMERTQLQSSDIAVSREGKVPASPGPASLPAGEVLSDHEKSPPIGSTLSMTISDSIQVSTSLSILEYKSGL